MRIPGGVDAPSRARRSVHAQLAGRVPAATASDAALLVSELVTNSVVHANVGPHRALTLDLTTLEDRVRIAVTDPGSRLTPRILPPDPETVGGLGLSLVEKLCETWGVRQDLGPTCVWCELLLDPHPPPEVTTPAANPPTPNPRPNATPPPSLTAAQALALPGQPHDATLESRSRTLPSRLARRVLAAGDADRQRIERDLHDGVQQRLTGLRIRLQLAADTFQERGDTDASATLNAFGEDVQQAIEEVRAFARGIYPLTLASEGLSAALASASRHTPTPITLTTHQTHRYRPEIESAVYFTCLAAIDNATKHAGPAHIYLHAWDTPQALHFTVRDTGHGFDPNTTPNGTGLTNMHDRITTIGGTLTLHSTPSHGTRLHGTIPNPWPDTPAGR